jgi:rhodanese-related sulfurtransferase
MELFLQFVVAKWYLVGAFVMLLGLLLAHENRKGAASISPAQVTALLNREDAVVLDLRDAAEYRQGHVVDSVNMPFAKLSERIAELERYRERPIVVVCKMGHHSGAVAKTLKEKGFTRVYRLGGGILEWQSAQLPLVRS